MNLLSHNATLANYAHTGSLVGQTALALYHQNLIFLEIVSVLITAAFIAGTIIIIIKTGWLSIRVDRVRDVILKTDMPKQQARTSWATAQQHFFSGNQNDLKMAIVEADNILNDALRYAGIEGTSLGERLKNIKRNQIPNLQEIWDAHKLRNEIAHGSNFSLKRDTAERALETYRTALENLGVFDDGK
jgi:uncharacterized membrane protein YraQ (UPF0718 family)